MKADLRFAQKPVRDTISRVSIDIPTRKCPVCGKVFVLRGSVQEWGPVYGSVPLCSIPCMREYERSKLLRDVEDLLQSRAFTYYKMRASGMTYVQIGKEMGVGTSSIVASIENLLDFHWKELDYLKDRGELPA